MQVGFLVDRLSALMMAVVTFVSLCVHVYTIGYMHEDAGYQRFFAYISLFTFAMLMLVMANNFLQLFFGWEAVGVVSYLLIGFWYTRPSAIFANLKAFLVNRVGDFGFLLGIAGVLYYTGSLDYQAAFIQAPQIAAHTLHVPGTAGWPAMTVICIVPVRRRHGQVGAGAAACVAARFDGRPDAHLGADPRGHHGDRRHIHGRAHVAAVRILGDRAVLRAGHRRHHGAVHGVPRHRQQRHQARGGLFDALAARLHDRGARRLGLQRRHLPPDDARLLQGAAVPGRRRGDHRHAPRAGHAQDGRPAHAHAGHLLDLPDRGAGADRHAVLLGLLFQGHADRCGACLASLRRRLCLLLRDCGRVRDRVLHLPDDLHDLPRRLAPRSSCAGALSRRRLGDEGAAGGAGDPLAADRISHRAAGALRRLLWRLDPGAAMPTTWSPRSAANCTAPTAFRPAFGADAAAVARRGRRALRLVLRAAPPRSGRHDPRAGGVALPPAGQQVLLRLVQRERTGARRPRHWVWRCGAAAIRP